MATIRPMERMGGGSAFAMAGQEVPVLGVVPRSVALEFASRAVLDWLSMQCFSGGRRLRRCFCLTLALINLVLGYRSALASVITTIAPQSLAGEDGVPGDLLETKARDRKPKPTRQQLSPTVERQAREGLSQRRKGPAALPTHDLTQGFSTVDSSRPIRGEEERSGASTEPRYLRPSEAVLLSQLPPPA